MQSETCQRNLDTFYSLSSNTPEVLREVYERESAQCRDRLVLVFTTKALVFKANEDDDTISIYSRKSTTFHKPGTYRKSRSGIWQRFIGKAFGWGWITVNQQGYCDGALLSFDGITPGVLLEVVASSIEMNWVASQDRVALQGGLQEAEIKVSENGGNGKNGVEPVRKRFDKYSTEATS
jgi:hypothetical protein